MSNWLFARVTNADCVNTRGCYSVGTFMPKSRGRSHTSLTETAALVVKVLSTYADIKMIAPGEITSTRQATTGQRWLTAVYTPAGMELIISGQSTQKVAVHTTVDAQVVFAQLRQDKRLRSFRSKERSRFPGT